jgi:hypothetical protein
LFSPVFLYPFALNPASWLIVGAFVVLLAVYYFAWAKSRFRGPRSQGSTEQLTEIEKEFQHAAGEVAGA